MDSGDHAWLGLGLDRKRIRSGAHGRPGSVVCLARSARTSWMVDPGERSGLGSGTWASWSGHTGRESRLNWRNRGGHPRHHTMAGVAHSGFPILVVDRLERGKLGPGVDRVSGSTARGRHRRGFHRPGFGTLAALLVSRAAGQGSLKTGMSILDLLNGQVSGLDPGRFVSNQGAVT